MMTITTTINSLSDKDTPFAWTITEPSETLKPINNNLGKTNSGVIFGYAQDNDLANGFFDVTGYDKVKWSLASVDDSKNMTLRLLAGEGTTMSQTVTEGTTDYEQLLTLTKCVSVKAESGASTCQNVTKIEFSKAFNSSSVTSFSIAGSASSTVAYDREFTAGQKSTVYLPFALTQEECNTAGTFYELTDYDGTTLTFTKVTSDGTTAYKPYLFTAKSTGAPFSSYSGKEIFASSGATAPTPVGSGGYTATMTGTLGHQSVNGKYGWSSADGVFYQATSDAVTIDAFRAYITVTGVASARGMLDVNFEDATMGIHSVKSETMKDNSYYDLLGRRVENPTKGVYIINGKKIMVR